MINAINGYGGYDEAQKYIDIDWTKTKNVIDFKIQSNDIVFNSGAYNESFSVQNSSILFNSPIYSTEFKINVYNQTITLDCKK